MSARLSFVLSLVLLVAMTSTPRAADEAFLEAEAQLVGPPTGDGVVNYRLVKLYSLMNGHPEEVSQITAICPGAPDLRDWRTVVVPDRLVSFEWRVTHKATVGMPLKSARSAVARMRPPTRGWIQQCACEAGGAGFQAPLFVVFLVGEEQVGELELVGGVLHGAKKFAFKRGAPALPPQTVRLRFAWAQSPANVRPLATAAARPAP